MSDVSVELHFKLFALVTALSSVKSVMPLWSGLANCEYTPTLIVCLATSLFPSLSLFFEIPLSVSH